MSYAAHRRDFAPYVDVARPAQRVAVPARRPSLLQRIAAAIFQSEARRIEREAAQFLARSGGHLTDNLEREMMAHLTSSGWRRRS